MLKQFAIAVFALPIVVCGSVIAASSLAIAADGEPVTIFYAPGDTSCGAWTNTRETNPEPLSRLGADHGAHKAWIEGYLTAAASRLPTDRGVDRDLTENINARQIHARIDDYCAANPSGNIADATDLLAYQLVIEWRAAHPPP